MSKIKVMPCGLGRMGALIVATLLADKRFEVLPYALEVSAGERVVEGHFMTLIDVNDRPEDQLRFVKQEVGEFMIVDFGASGTSNNNAKLFCKVGVPFIMGTTGGDRDQLTRMVDASDIPAVVAPNMSAEVVFMQALLNYGRVIAPKMFKDWLLEIEESHQAAKGKEPSGTALAFAREFFVPQGAKFVPGTDLKIIRTPEVQLTLGIATEHLDGHGWHDYLLTNPEGTAQLGFKHNINGREPYVRGAITALLYLHKMVASAQPGCYSMLDVLSDK